MMFIGFKTWLNEQVSIPVGLCFEWATKNSIKSFIDGTLVHGLVKTNDHPDPYYHAWIESDNNALDWQMQVDNWQKIKPFTELDYYSVPLSVFREKFQVLKEKRYKPARAIGFMHQYSHYGPWEI